MTMTKTTIGTHSRNARSAGPRRWWQALDQLTLETMNPPIPAHVRAAMSDRTGVRPDATVPGAHVPDAHCAPAHS
jgi:hypothetical protein